MAKIKHMDGPGWVRALNKAYRAHHEQKEQAAVTGTDMHARLEEFVKAHMNHSDWPVLEDDVIYPFVRWTMENVRQFIWSEAHCYSLDLFCGGISDIGAILKDGSVAVIDAKSSREAYISHFIQSAGYAIQIEENGLFDPEGNQIKAPGEIPPIDTLIIVPFRSNPVTPAIVKGIGKFKEGFRSCVQLHKLVEGIQV